MCIALLASMPFGSVPSAEAAHAGHNGVIAFVRTVNGHRHLFTISPDGTGEQQITSGNTDDTSPDWSPDGSKIAFVRCCPHGVHQIMVLTVATGQLINISHSPTDDLDPSWGPGGGRIVFDRSQEIWVMRADGSHQHRITQTAKLDSDPSWSDHGDLAFVRCCSDGWNPSIYVLLAGTTAARQFVGARDFGDGSSTLSAPDWQPGGTGLAYQDSSLTSDGPRAGIAWSNGKDGGWFDGFAAFCVSACIASGPAWAPDGTLVAYSLVPDDGVHLAGVYTLPVCFDPCGAQPTFLTSGSDPAWQPLPFG